MPSLSTFTRCVLAAALVLAPPSSLLAQQLDEQALKELMKQHGGNMPAFDPAQMEALAAQAKALQRCMARIDMQALSAMQAEAEALRGKLKGLCAAGQREEAAAEAIRYGREVASSSVMQEMAACGEGVSQMIPWLAALSEPAQLEQAGVHVCDAP